MVQLVYVVCFSVESIGFSLISGPFTIIYVCAYYIYLFFRLICFKGNYTDNYCGACRNGRYHKYGT